MYAKLRCDGAVIQVSVCVSMHKLSTCLSTMIFVGIKTRNSTSEELSDPFRRFFLFISVYRKQEQLEQEEQKSSRSSVFGVYTRSRRYTLTYHTLFQHAAAQCDCSLRLERVGFVRRLSPGVDFCLHSGRCTCIRMYIYIYIYISCFTALPTLQMYIEIYTNIY